MKKPAKGGWRRLSYKPPGQAKIETLREHAHRLIDFHPFLLANHPEWRDVAISIAKAFIAQNPKMPKTPHDIAAEVDEDIEFHLERNVPLAQAVRRARTAVAKTFRRSRDSVKKAHMRHGRLGVRG